MKRFKNISLVDDRDLLTLERAATLAKDNRGKLTIVYPVQNLPGGLQRLAVGSGSRTVDVKRLVPQEFEARLKQAAFSVRSLVQN